MMLKGTILIVLAIGINVTLVSGKFTFMFLQEFKHKDDDQYNLTGVGEILPMHHIDEVVPKFSCDLQSLCKVKDLDVDCWKIKLCSTRTKYFPTRPK